MGLWTALGSGLRHHALHAELSSRTRRDFRLVAIVRCALVDPISVKYIQIRLNKGNVIVMGSLNAKVDLDNSLFGHVMGRHSLVMAMTMVKCL